MFNKILTIQVGKPLRHEALSVFPLFSPASGEVHYALAEEAFEDESLLVKEVDEGGSVPDLLVENQGDTMVLFMDGEHLIGAKQNRVLNTSILVAAHSQLKIPVSCVEAGRWRYTSRRFGSGGTHSPSKIRYALKKSGLSALKEGRGCRSDQGEVWDKVAEVHAVLGSKSPTGAMEGAFEAAKDRSADYWDKLPYVDGAIGVAVAIGKQVVAVDLFDKPPTCQKLWKRLLSGAILDALAAGAAGVEQADTTDVDRLLAQSSDATWESVPTVGEGEEYRAEFADEQGSALAFGETLVHGSVLASV